MALSMEEQRMLDEMERQLAIDDPKLASRFNAFGQQRLPGTLHSQRIKTVVGLLALALIAAVTVMMFVLSPYATHHGPTHHGATSAGSAKTAHSHPGSGS